ncbi:hypothetical protein [Devriesea agamarum]|uniref:hypothetical protein n=1 Tax=Devriesea agamarum TaxID=472569 RepID=UPI00071DD2DC|nr:hypothetical protein [Devriesea agamarum]
MREARKPNPGVLRGSIDPARRVRPVDWTSHLRDRPRQDVDTLSSSSREGSQAPAPGDCQSFGLGNPTQPSAQPTPGRLEAQRSPRRRPTAISIVPVPSPPPADALVTLDDDRSMKPLTIPGEEQLRLVGIDSLDRDAIVLTVADPHEAWTSDAGRSDHFLRGQLCVQVERAHNTVVGVFTRGYSLAVRPEITEYVRGAAFRHGQPGEGEVADVSARPRSGGLGTRHPTTSRELLARLREAGFEVRTSGKTHGRITHPDYPGLFVPWSSSPSDVRYSRHVVAQVRRVFGIDLRT